MSRPLTVFACPPHCSAGGPPNDGGHKFDKWLAMWRCSECGHEYLTDEPESIASICPNCYQRTCRESGGSMVCATCGLSAIDWSLMRPTPPCSHRLVRSPFVPSCVVCERCGEGAGYLYGSPGSEDAQHLGCKCSVVDNHHGKGRGGDGPRYGWEVDKRCRLHMPEDELEAS